MLVQKAGPIVRSRTKKRGQDPQEERRDEGGDRSVNGTILYGSERSTATSLGNTSNRQLQDFWRNREIFGAVREIVTLDERVNQAIRAISRENLKPFEPDD